MGALFGFTGMSAAEETHALQKTLATAIDFRGKKVTWARDEECGVALGACTWEWEKGRRVICTTDGTIIAACEGEIYAIEGSHAASFDTQDCFALVPQLYEQYGRDCARLLNGVFTIALWDKRQRHLVLIRDHLGSHSLFYTRAAERVFFSTTARSIISASGRTPTISPEALVGYLSSLSVTPPHTMLRDVHAVRPGHSTRLCGTQTDEQCYWDLGKLTENYHPTEKQWAQQLQELFIDAVSIRSNFGGSVGCLISGGVDTTSLAALLSKNTTSPLAGFSIAYNEQEYSDSGLQKIVTKAFPIKLTNLTVSPQQFEDALLGGVAHLDTPVNDVAFAGMYLAMQLAAQHGCSAVFDGEASDELFTTGHSQGERSVQSSRMIPPFLKRLLATMVGHELPLGSGFSNKVQRYLVRLAMSDSARRSTWMPVFHGQLLRELMNINPLPHNPNLAIAHDYYNSCRLKDPINQYQMALSKLFLPDDLLYKNERAAAANGVINRTPYIDYRLVEAAFQIPARYKICKPSADSDGTKLIMKRALEGIVPHEILYRKKTRGFSQPISLWYRSELKSFAHEHLLGANARYANYLDQGVVRSIWEKHQQGSNLDYLLNSVLILELWLRSITNG
jgi:asparagine synthase (glutamine-hydrolysing)